MVFIILYEISNFIRIKFLYSSLSPFVKCGNISSIVSIKSYGEKADPFLFLSHSFLINLRKTGDIWSWFLFYLAILLFNIKDLFEEFKKKFAKDGV